MPTLPTPCPPTVICPHEFAPDLFKSYRNRKPLVIRGLLSPKDLCKWTGPQNDFSCMSEIFHSLIPKDTAGLNVMRSHDGRVFVDDDRITYRELVPAMTVLDQVKQPTTQLPNGSCSPALDIESALGPQSSRLYYREVVPIHLHSTLPLPAIESACNLTSNLINPSLIKLWASSHGCVTPLHFDRCHGLLIQLVGSKYFMQFCSDDTPNIYPSHSIHLPRHMSQVPYASLLFGIDPRTGEPCTELSPELAARLKWTLEKFPRLKHCSPFGILLKPGDAIYTPPGWFHEVVSVSGSVSVTVPFDMSIDEYNLIPPYMARAASPSPV